MPVNSDFTNRSTPAHAGNTTARNNKRGAAGVYPRPRGEYAERVKTSEQLSGLPPPTRGIHAPPHPPYAHRRSTPAHAGNTSAHPKEEPLKRVYPRPRGEYSTSSGRVGSAMGLPPPTRGIRSKEALRITRARSTPAHAGNTLSRPGGWRLPEVYPRPRGEYENTLGNTRQSTGLPPPTRGIPHP